MNAQKRSVAAKGWFSAPSRFTRTKRDASLRPVSLLDPAKTTITIFVRLKLAWRT
jgi:hypothetical protein